MSAAASETGLVADNEYKRVTNNKMNGATGINGERITTCGLCFNLLVDPLTLPCSDSFCMRCVKNQIVKSKKKDDDEREFFTCSLCTKDMPISADNLDQYYNQPLKDYIMQLSKGGPDRPRCQWCEEQPSDVYCDACQAYYCDGCSIAVHKHSAKRSHRTVPWDQHHSMNVVQKCSLRGHEEYRLEIFCTRCEDLCCVYCLQAGPHKNCGAPVLPASEASAQMRQMMDRDLEKLGQTRTRIELLANDLNRTHSQYQETYDHVESFVSDRFTAFRHQLMQKEVEIRKQLQGLRDVGDRTLADTRSAFLRKLDSINGAGLTGRRLQNGGSDFEVLRNKSKIADLIATEVPGISGSGFHIADLGDLNLAGLQLTLDLNASMGTGVIGMTISGGDSRALALNTQGSTANPRQYSPTQPSVSMAPRPNTPPMRFTFGPEEFCTIKETSDGVRVMCKENVAKQVGVRANEAFEQMRNYMQQDGGVIVWKVRLDQVWHSFFGVVDAEPQDDEPVGIHWRPMKVNEFDITTGRATTVLQNIPPCNAGDIIKFTYEYSKGVLKLAINGVDKGVIATDVPAALAPACILSPGEVVTFLRN